MWLFILVILFLSPIYVLYELRPVAKKYLPYRNLLGLKGISKNKDLMFDGKLFSSGLQEFVHIAEALRAWGREDKKLADFVHTEEERKAYLYDLDLLEMIAIRDLEDEKLLPAASQSVKLIENRKHFIEKTYPAEKSHLLAWQAPLENAVEFKLMTFNGICVLTYQEDRVAKLVITLKEVGTFSFVWYENYGVTKNCETFPDCTVMGEAKIPIIFSTPQNRGAFFVFSQENDLYEKIPLS